TDKLADEEDDVTGSLPDITGVFFRHDLLGSLISPGKIPSTGSMLGDIFIGRTIEELPLITGQMGGVKAISLTLDAIESYEKGTGMAISDTVKELREKLTLLEKDLVKAVNEQNRALYRETAAKIRSIAGNMNLSNLYFGGFKTPVNHHGYDDFDNYRSSLIEFKDGSYSSGRVSFKIDDKGIIREFDLVKTK
ncbi:MAG: hypothetical protein ACTSRU_20895, partial [Candidatus Hodarchaeales archaeon]